MMRKYAHLNPPSLLVHLFLNVTTQLVCVCGVNQLASSTSALSVSVVLNLRKFTSLVISFVIFGHRIDAGVVMGAVLVFVGALWYSQEAGHAGNKVNAKNSSCDLQALGPARLGDKAGSRKIHGTPMLEKGAFEEMPPTPHRRISVTRISES